MQKKNAATNNNQARSYLSKFMHCIAGLLILEILFKFICTTKLILKDFISSTKLIGERLFYFISITMLYLLRLIILWCIGYILRGLTLNILEVNVITDPWCPTSIMFYIIWVVIVNFYNYMWFQCNHPFFSKNNFYLMCLSFFFCIIVRCLFPYTDGFYLWVLYTLWSIFYDEGDDLVCRAAMRPDINNIIHAINIEPRELAHHRMSRRLAAQFLVGDTRTLEWMNKRWIPIDEGAFVGFNVGIDICLFILKTEEERCISWGRPITNDIVTYAQAHARVKQLREEIAQQKLWSLISTPDC